MAFLYLKTGFEKIIEGALRELSSSRLCLRVNDSLILGEPHLHEDYESLMRLCIFSGGDADSEISKKAVFGMDYRKKPEFAAYYRMFRDEDSEEGGDLVIVKDEEEELSDSLLTRLVNEHVHSEVFEIGDAIASFKLKNNAFYLELDETMDNRVSSDAIRLISRGPVDFKGNEGEIGEIIKDVTKAALDYALDEGQLCLGED